MLELLFLLLPIAALYGWYMGVRSVKKDQESVKNQFSREYVTGLNFLLSNQQEKAVDLFLSLLQKQEAENQIASESQFDAELTLGNLFRSRGELDRALRIHQALDQNPNYSVEQKLLAKQQLAKDFMAVGFYDRAENYYITLLDEPEFAVNSLSQLMSIYQKTKEWKKAINVGEKLLKIAPNEDPTPLAHFYCEYAQNMLQNDPLAYLQTLQKALVCMPKCARASMMIGDYYLQLRDFQQALWFYSQILTQDSDYLCEVIDRIKACHIALNDPTNYELFLVRANQIKHNVSVDLALVEFIEQTDGREAAQAKLYQQLTKYPNMLAFHRFIGYQVEDAEQGRGRDSLKLLYDMVGEKIAKSMHYRCLHCGYQSHRQIWHCPSCRRWETVKPVQSIEGIN